MPNKTSDSGVCCAFCFFISSGERGIAIIGTLQQIKGNKFDVKYSLFSNMLYPDCNELDPFFIIWTIYQYRYQNPTVRKILISTQTKRT